MGKKYAGLALIFFCTIQFFCSSNRLIDPEKAKPGESVQILTIDGKQVEGILIAREGSVLKFVDAQSHQLENLETAQVVHLQRSDRIYDLEGKVITEPQIHEVKRCGKTVGYSVAGVALGAAVGFGVGAVLASQSDIPIGYSMVLFGIGGGITMGLMGGRADREEAIEKIRQERLKATHTELQEQLQKEQKLLDEEKKQKEKMIKDLEQKKK